MCHCDTMKSVNNFRKTCHITRLKVQRYKKNAKPPLARVKNLVKFVK